MTSSDRFWVLVPAAGQGRRYGGLRAKQYQGFGGRALLVHTLERILTWPDIAGVLLVLAPEDSVWSGVAQTAWAQWPPRLRVSTHGGRERMDTVRNGLTALTAAGAGDRDWVLVHDAARPGVRTDQVVHLMQHCRTTGEGGLLALPARDTLHLADDARLVQATLDRAAINQAQTPQCFRLGELAGALNAAATRGEALTDEAAAMVAAHKPAHLLPGDWRNFKLTRSEDEPLMRWILSDEH